MRWITSHSVSNCELINNIQDCSTSREVCKYIASLCLVVLWLVADHFVYPPGLLDPVPLKQHCKMMIKKLHQST